MQYQYFEPLSKAWRRMVKALFKPFDIGKWFAVGFTAFLANLMEFGNGGGQGKKGGGGFEDFSLHDFFSLPEIMNNWILDNPGWFTFIISMIILVFIIVIVLTWVGSRGKFMFLDNVIHDRKLVKAPWKEFKTQGDSLFLWRLVYLFVVLFIFGFYIWFCYSTLQEMYFDYASDGMLITYGIFMGLGLILMFIISGYIGLFLNDFVVPIMYKKGQKSMVAWGHFMVLFSKARGYFLLYGLFALFLFICVVILVVLFGLFTCCIGFVLLVLPYIGSVITLPISYTFRAFSIEFLEQAGPDYQFFPATSSAIDNNPESENNIE